MLKTERNFRLFFSHFHCFKSSDSRSFHSITEASKDSWAFIAFLNFSLRCWEPNSSVCKQQKKMSRKKFRLVRSLLSLANIITLISTRIREVIFSRDHTYRANWELRTSDDGRSVRGRNVVAVECTERNSPTLIIEHQWTEKFESFITFFFAADAVESNVCSEKIVDGGRFERHF